MEEELIQMMEALIREMEEPIMMMEALIQTLEELIPMEQEPTQMMEALILMMEELILMMGGHPEEELLEEGQLEMAEVLAHPLNRPFLVQLAMAFGGKWHPATTRYHCKEGGEANAVLL